MGRSVKNDESPFFASELSSEVGEKSNEEDSSLALSPAKKKKKSYINDNRLHRSKRVWDSDSSEMVAEEDSPENIPSDGGNYSPGLMLTYLLFIFSCMQPDSIDRYVHLSVGQLVGQSVDQSVGNTFAF